MRKLKGKIALCVSLILLMVCATPAFAYTNVGNSAGEDCWNLDDIKWEDTDEAIPVLVYMYIEDSVETYPTATISFNGEFYVELSPFSYANSPTYEESNVISKLFYLPKGTYSFLPSCSSFSEMETEYQIIDNTQSYSKDGEMDIVENGNEVFIVLGSKDWMKEQGREKLDEIFSLYSTHEEVSEAPTEIEDVIRMFRENPNLDVVLLNGAEYTKESLRETTLQKKRFPSRVNCRT